MAFPPNHPRSFDPCLSQMPPASLEVMANAWCSQPVEKHANRLQCILQALDNSQFVQRRLAEAPAYLRLALALVKQQGGGMLLAKLTAALRVSGVSLPADKPSRYSLDPLKEILLNSGFFIVQQNAEMTSWCHHLVEEIWSDERILQYVDRPDCPALPVFELCIPEKTISRRPIVVLLELSNFLRQVEHQESLYFKPHKTLMVSSAKKLAKGLQWPEDSRILDGMIWHQPITALAEALRHTPLMKFDPSQRNQCFRLQYTAAELTAHPPLELVASFVEGFIGQTGWHELPEYRYPTFSLPMSRAAILELLRHFPKPGCAEAGFVAIADLDQIWFDRAYDSIHLQPSNSYNNLLRQVYDISRQVDSPAELRQRTREAWQQTQSRWLRGLFSTWLYGLGLVELGVNHQQVESVRLTELGWQLLHPEDRQATLPALQELAWLIQPNFEITVYLDHVQPFDLNFLEQVAERLQLQTHIAQYRLTKEAFYHGLQRGYPLQQILQHLEEKARTGIPQNVRLDLEQWAALREEVTIWRRSYLLEFADPAARDRAIAQGTSGYPIGDRFLRLSEPQTLYCEAQATIDYAFAIDPDLHLTAGFSLIVTQTCATTSTKGMDLLLPPLLDFWADRQGEHQWQLTRDSLDRAVQAGGKIADFLSRLEPRLTHPLSILQRRILEAWSGQPWDAMEMGQAILFRCPDTALLQAMQEHPALKPYIQEELRPDTLVIAAQHVAAFSATLEHWGFTITRLR